MTRARIAGAVLLLCFAALALARSAPPIVNIADIGVTELYVDLASHGELLVGPYSRFQWHHPGPLYFFLQAPLYVASGRAGASVFAGAWAINVGAFALMLWTLYRERCVSLTIAVGAAILVLAWRLPDLLASPWTAHVPILPFLALVTVAAAVAARRTGLLPAAALLASFVTQTNLALLPAVAMVLALMTPAIVRSSIRSPGPGRRHVVQAAAIALVVWLPSLVEAVRHRGGNIAALWAFFSGGGMRHPFSEAMTAWSVSVAGVMRGHLELPWGKPLDPGRAEWEPAAAVVITALTIAATIIWTRRKQVFEAWLGAMLTGSLLITLWSLTRIFEPIGDYHVLLGIALGAMASGVVLAAAASATFRTLESDRHLRAVRAVAIGLSLAAAVLAAVHFQRMVGLQQRLPWAEDVVPAVDRIEAYLDGWQSRTAVVDVGGVWSQGVPIVLRLRQHGRQVSVASGDLFIFTDAFASTGKEDTRLALQPGRQAAVPGHTMIFDSWTIGVLARTP